jgi:translation initiation factor IF-2
MAKIKVHELAKELGVQSKDVLTFLNDKGVEAKAAQSSVEDTAADMVRKHFGGAASAPKAEKPAEEKAPAKKENPVKKDAPKAAEEAPKKKKKTIIIVNNSGNSQMGGNKGGQRPGQQNNNRKPMNNGGMNNGGNNRNGAKTFTANTGYNPIKPRVKASQPEAGDDFRLHNRNPQQNTVNEAGGRNEKAEQPAREPRKENRNENKNFSNQRNNAGQSAAPRQNGPRPDRGPDNRFKKGGQSAPAFQDGGKDTEKRSDNQRRNNPAKDKKSKKDLIYEEDENVASKKNRPGRFIKPEKKVQEVVEEQIKVITIPEMLTIKELADKMKMQPSVIIKKLFLQGQIVTVNSEITFEEAENIAIDYEIMCEKEVPVDVIEELLKEDEEDESKMVKRPPVVCVMGHVDHGKTSLLDAIRKTDVTEKEAGGITQAIGAYTVKVNDQKITFLDTPGHEAFTAMRMRGANATDIAILVVAADDGVMPQTVEAINHAKAAGVEIIVAINKIDKPGANIDKVKQELMEYELVPTDWGGSTEFVPVSAKSREGLDTLLETILLTAEIMELKANKKRKARGLVIEAKLDKGRGPVATILVQKGTLKIGDFISAGASYGKVRAMIDDKGKRVKEAGPSKPVEILGLSDVPEAGEVFLAHDSDKTAKTYAETYMAQHKEQLLADTKTRMSLDSLFDQMKEGDLKELDLVIKADVQGSVEALKTSLMKLSNEEIIVKCIHGGVGAITESDVTLASASNAIIIGFNVKPDAQAKIIAERENVDIHLYDVIYQAIEDVERHIKGMEAPVYEERVIGHAEVRQIFKASAIGNIAGAYVLDGIFKRNCSVRISREGTQIFEGKLASLKRFKDDVKEVKEGFECGLVFEDFDKMQELDIVEAYEMVEVPRS